MVYIYIAFTIQFPAGYWDRSTPVSVPAQVQQPEICDHSEPPRHSTALPAGWSRDPYIGDWSIYPETESFISSLDDADKKVLEELLLNTKTSSPKIPRITRFYNLDTERDWEDHMSKLDDEV